MSDLICNETKKSSLLFNSAVFRMNGRTDRQKDRQMDGWMDRRTDGRMDRHTLR